IGRKLIIFPILLIYLYSFYIQSKHKNLFINLSKFVKYSGLFMLSIGLSSLFGIIVYPYFNEITNGPANQIDKLPMVVNYLKSLGFSIDEGVLTLAWFLFRAVKTAVLDYCFTFGLAYIIYCWYRNDSRVAFRIFEKGTISISLLIIAVSYIEIFYFWGNHWAKSVLIYVNPIFHDIKSNGMWWPPLLWTSQQIRSLFAEPSYFGMYSVMLIPVLVNKIFTLKDKWNLLGGYFLLANVLFFLFLTKARTAVVLLLAVLIIQLFLIIVYKIKEKCIWKKIVSILAILVVSFLASNYSMTFYTTDQTKINNSVSTQTMDIDKYVDENLKSVVNTTQRSNGARFSIIKADLSIAKDYPILGVGYGLRTRYIFDYLPKDAFNNGEVKMWNELLHNQGIMKFSYPSLSEYAFKLSQTGILGLIVFFIPVGLVLKKLVVKIKKYKQFDTITMLTMFLGFLITGLGDALIVLAAYWIILALSFVHVEDKVD
ncbi:O-antigen ligase family protein, partial [Veillonella sp.]|uniref:O-antigen ligase family protein n=1 Tax=Veillonella sp. TaxID=1926307 RepID=UPI0025D298A6